MQSIEEKNNDLSLPLTGTVSLIGKIRHQEKESKYEAKCDKCTMKCYGSSREGRIFFPSPGEEEKEEIKEVSGGIVFCAGQPRMKYRAGRGIMSLSLPVAAHPPISHN